MPDIFILYNFIKQETTRKKTLNIAICSAFFREVAEFECIYAKYIHPQNFLSCLKNFTYLCLSILICHFVSKFGSPIEYIYYILARYILLIFIIFYTLSYRVFIKSINTFKYYFVNHLRV